MKRKGTTIQLQGLGYTFGLLCAIALILTLNARAQDRDLLEVEKQFVASGWVGDGKATDTRFIRLLERCEENPHSGPACIKITYREFGTEGWGGIYWQNKPENWGNKRGEDLTKAGYKSVTFWARGEQGDEMVEFKAGDIDEKGNPYRDSFRATAGKVFLSRKWQKFYIDLQGKDLSSVIGGFCWIASKTGNPNGLTFYIDDICYTHEIAPRLDYLDIGSRFAASGWMGDGEFGTASIKLLEACKDNPHSKPACIRISYVKFGRPGWGGIYWQNRMENWGDYPGEDLSKAQYKSMTFWAKGEEGGEMIEFKAGGIEAAGKEYKDSFDVSLGKIGLTREWQKYSMSLEGKNLSSVIGGFCWVASQTSNADSLAFCLDDIRFEKK